ncbi:MAG: molecular chaperone DnaJ [Micavibrio sp.]|nr:molecular chaperone DnaJ [Micavibrio sp.]|tara:strand:+ start:5724 stop:6212 length:489 start_codon:yes stop_codon:yes gene_type:complete
MNIKDAAKILGLSGDITPELAKTAYRAACKKYHPDINPAGEDMMKVINEAFDALKDFTGEVKDQQTDYGDLLNTALNKAFGLPGIKIEICGAWIWLTGNTREHKDELKESGYKWASKKKAWYFRPEEYRSRSQGNKTLDEIRAKYGSVKPARNNYMISGGAS